MPSICQSCLVFNVFLQRTCSSLLCTKREIWKKGFSQPPARETFPRGSAQGSRASRCLPWGCLPMQAPGFTSQSLKSAVWWPQLVTGLVFKSLTALCKMSSLHFWPWKLRSPLCCTAVPPLQDGEADREAERCQVRAGENVYWFLLSYKGAQSSEEQLVLFAAFHIPHRTKGPTPTSRQEGEPFGQLLGVRGHRGVGVHCGGGRRHAQHPGLRMPPLPPASNLPLPTDVSSSVLERKEPSVLFTF